MLRPTSDDFDWSPRGRIPIDTVDSSGAAVGLETVASVPPEPPPSATAVPAEARSRWFDRGYARFRAVTPLLGTAAARFGRPATLVAVAILVITFAGDFVVRQSQAIASSVNGVLVRLFTPIAVTLVPGASSVPATAAGPSLPTADTVPRPPDAARGMPPPVGSSGKESAGPRQAAPARRSGAPAVRRSASGQTRVLPSVATGLLNLNAIPWAEVWIDGELVGETPIGNVRLDLGRHRVVFRHPDFGEREASIVVRENEPAYATMDFSSGN